MGLTGTVTNTGAKATNISLLVFLPYGYGLDETSFLFSTSAPTTTVVKLTGYQSSPYAAIFGLVPDALLTNQSISYSMQFYPTTGPLDNETRPYGTAVESYPGNGDPAPWPSTTVGLNLQYSPSCVATPQSLSASYPVTPLVADLDISVSPTPHGQTVVKPSTNQNYDFTIVNNGPASSVAAFPSFSISSIGGGFTIVSVSITTPGTGGVAGVCPGNACDNTRIGTISTSTSVVIRVVVSVFDNDQPLRLWGKIVNPVVVPSTGSSNNTGYLSIDETAVLPVGLQLSKALQSKCQSSLSSPTIVGEDMYWSLFARFFGSEVRIHSYETSINNVL